MQARAAIRVDKANFNRHSVAHRFRFRLTQIGYEANSLFQLDQDYDWWLLAGFRGRMARNDPAIDGAASAGPLGSPLQRMAGRTHRARRHPQPRTTGASLKPQFAGRDALPKEAIVGAGCGSGPFHRVRLLFPAEFRLSAPACRARA